MPICNLYRLASDNSAALYTTDEISKITDLSLDRLANTIRASIEHGNRVMSKWPAATELDRAVLVGALVIDFAILGYEEMHLNRDKFAQLVIAMVDSLFDDARCAFAAAHMLLESDVDLDAVHTVWEDFRTACDDIQRKQVMASLDKWEPLVLKYCISVPMAVCLDLSELFGAGAKR